MEVVDNRLGKVERKIDLLLSERHVGPCKPAGLAMSTITQVVINFMSRFGTMTSSGNVCLCPFTIQGMTKLVVSIQVLCKLLSKADGTRSTYTHDTVFQGLLSCGAVIITKSLYRSKSAILHRVFGLRPNRVYSEGRFLLISTNLFYSLVKATKKMEISQLNCPTTNARFFKLPPFRRPGDHTGT